MCSEWFDVRKQLAVYATAPRNFILEGVAIFGHSGDVRTEDPRITDLFLVTSLSLSRFLCALLDEGGE